MSDQDKPSYDELYRLWLDARAKLAACKECGPDCIDQGCAQDTDRWRQYFSFAPYGMFIADSQGRYIEVNPAAETITGYVAEELTQMSIADILHPDDLQTGMASFQTLRETGSCKVDLRYVRKDGQVRWWTVTGTRIDENRHLGFVNDITERKQAEQALRDSEARYRCLAENFPDGALFLIGPDWRYEAANGKAFIDARLAPEMVVGRSVQEVFPELWDTLQEPIRRAFQGEDVYYEVEYQGRSYSNRSVYIPAQPGTEPRVLIITQDITEQKAAQAERDQLQEQLIQSQKLSAVGKLAGGVAHDFNNMLNVILGHADMLLQDLAPDHPVRQDIEAIHSAALRSADLTRQLLAFARRQTIAPKLLDLNQTIASMLSMLGRLIGENIDLLWQPAQAIAPVHIDPAQVDQLLTNLVINARDAIDGTGKITIETAEIAFDEEYCNTHPDFLPGRYVMLGVSDDGRGMDAETRKHIFEPFFTTKGIGEGTGLGLATSYGIIKQNGGFVNVYSEPDQGTSLHIYLPAAQVETAAGETPAASSAEAMPTGNETILLVEDEPPILAMAEKMLARLGYRVLAAATPAQAIQHANEQTGPIDLLVTDVVMPQMHGRDLAAKLTELHPTIRKIFMSGYTANVIAHQGVLDEGVHFIQKPFSAKILGEKIREVLDELDESD